MQVFGPNELQEDVLKKGLCVGCGACVGLCPYFKTYKGKTAMLFPCTLTQGRCHAFCPKTEVDLEELAQRYWGKSYEGTPLGEHQEIVRARAGDRMGPGPYQAGGTVSALLAQAFKSGLVEAAVLTDRQELVPVPRLARSLEEAARCASSKYMAAPTLAAYNQALAEGLSRVGVVGTPCQVTALAQMRANPLQRDDFRDAAAMVIGLFCTWALDTRGLIRLLADRLDTGRIKKMDLPPPPSEIMVLETEDGRVEVPLSEIRPLVPAGCHICPDMTSEWADLSVGVVEGQPDWNTLIVRTRRGRDLVEQAKADGMLVTEPMPADNLANLNLAAGNKKKRAWARTREDGLLNSDGEGRRSAIRVPVRVVESIDS
ncbi:MAG: Coenzyme F420 hydrogenase/dehydrogenase, beta subunit C-terminal domain [Proteobacteria bacterium]|nr:Coenzyme F420 hydrogenase/dehydrogenase, beta subunit C-terminal domain [Pseudomonadota bacterium]